MLKLEKSQCLNSIFQLNYTKYEKKVIIQNCLLDYIIVYILQVWTTNCMLKGCEKIFERKAIHDFDAFF